MLDIKYICENAEKIKETIENKNIDLDLDNLLEVNKKRIELLMEIELI